MTVHDAAWLQGAEEICAGPISLAEKADLLFSIGKYCDDIKDYDRAFQSYALLRLTPRNMVAVVGVVQGRCVRKLIFHCIILAVAGAALRRRRVAVEFTL